MAAVPPEVLEEFEASLDGMEAAWKRGMLQHVAEIEGRDYANFNPNQPRDPAGSPTGGQWTAATGGPSVQDWRDAARKAAETEAEQLAEQNRRLDWIASLTDEEVPEFKTYIHAENWLEKRYPWVKVDLYRVDQGMIKDVASEFDSLARKYPLGMVYFKYFGTLQTPGKTGEAFKISHDAVLGRYGWDLTSSNTWAKANQRVLLLNPRFFNDPTYLRNALNADGGRKPDSQIHKPFHDGMKDVKSIITHEYGHVYAFALRGRSRAFRDVVTTDDFGLTSSLTTEFMEKNYKYAVAMDKQIREKAASAPGKKPTHYLRRRQPVSGYALANSEEWFAETFAAAKYGDKIAKQTDDVKQMNAFLSLVNQPRYRELLNLPSSETKAAIAASGIIPEDKAVWASDIRGTPLGHKVPEAVAEAARVRKELGLEDD